MKNANRHINNVDYWQADILSAYDYSPFGVMLSGRTFEKEETVQVCHNETTLTTTPVLEEGFGSWGSWNAINSALLTYVNSEMQVSNPSNSSNNIGASKTFVTGSGVHSVSFDIIDNTCATIVLWPPSVTPKTINVYIRDNANNVVASGAYTTAGNYSLSFTPATTGATYKIEFYMASSSAFCYYRIDDVLITYQSEQITQVCEQVSKKGKYRYGFNGQERDDQIKGRGNSYDFGARMQDPRLGGRFFSIDAFANKFASQSPYAFAGNSPIGCIDHNGDSVLFYSSSGTYLGYSHDNERYKGKNLLVIINDKDVDRFTVEYDRKRAITEYPEARKTEASRSAYKEAIIAGLEAMGTVYDITQIQGFVKKYEYLVQNKESGIISEAVKEVLNGTTYYTQTEWEVYMKPQSNPYNKSLKNWIVIDENTIEDTGVHNIVSFYGDYQSYMHTHTQGSKKRNKSDADGNTYRNKWKYESNSHYTFFIGTRDKNKKNMEIYFYQKDSEEIKITEKSFKDAK